MFVMLSRLIAFLVFISILKLCYANSDNETPLDLFGGQYEFIDLTYPFDNHTIYWPGIQKFEFTKKTEKHIETDKPFSYTEYEFKSAEHGGTHMDAPFHFYSTGAHVGDIPLDKLIVPLKVVDISSIVNGDPSFILYKNHLEYKVNDINEGRPCLLIFKFGWSQFYQSNKYLGWNAQKRTLNFPGLSAEVANWIKTEHKNVVGVGVDVSSVDPGTSQEFAAHRILAEAGLYNIENVNMSRDIPESGCTALALPMKVTEGTGAPLRLVAICPMQAPAL